MNSWGDNEQIISRSDADRGLHSRYAVNIKTLVYKGFETGDIPMVWANDEGRGNNIYNENGRKTAFKKWGCDHDYTASEMKKMFYDLCIDFGLTIEGDYEPEPKKSKWNFFSKKKPVVVCDDF